MTIARDSALLCTIVVNYAYALHFALLSDVILAIYNSHGDLYPHRQVVRPRREQHGM